MLGEFYGLPSASCALIKNICSVMRPTNDRHEAYLRFQDWEANMSLKNFV